MIGMLAAVAGVELRRAVGPGLSRPARRCVLGVAVGDRGAARRPVRVQGQARRGHEGRRHAVRRARRRAGPARRRPVRRSSPGTTSGGRCCEPGRGRGEARPADDRAAQRAARRAARACSCCSASCSPCRSPSASATRRASSATSSTSRSSAPRCSTICFIAPSAVHRLRFHQSERAYVIESANKLLIAGLVLPRAWRSSCAVLLITDVLYDGPRVVLYSRRGRAAADRAVVPAAAVPARARAVVGSLGERAGSGPRGPDPDAGRVGRSAGVLARRRLLAVAPTTARSSCSRAICSGRRARRSSCTPAGCCRGPATSAGTGACPRRRATTAPPPCST